MTIPAISTTNGQPTILYPLSFILMVNILKDLFEDLSRRASDKKENQNKVSLVIILR